ncbi:CoxG family protein [Neobacillus niacini]|uniref:CoxG family protein n=1 Tax=Neobacillus niacini TaxID=86668 RepID=UPI0021CB8A83|nr:SRPBCC domain-containing protein [Neobacillus niacini]MCM3768690.1 SRPBCC domain-containing protein [Neobacillus niacini]
MRIEYSYTFDLPKDTVWRYIQDDRVLRSSLPGCQTFEEMPSGIYAAELGLNTGPVKGLFSAEVQQVDQIPPTYYRLLVKGKGKPGEIDAVADMILEEAEEAEGGTKITCVAEIEVTGVLASVGQRVMVGVAKVILGQFFKAAEKEMQNEI